MANPRRRTARMGGATTRTPASRPTTRADARQPTLRQRARYAFDNTMARGTPALVGWLAALTAVVVLLFTLIVLIGGLAPKDSGGHRPGLIGQAFKTMLHALDPGTVAGDTGKWPFLLAMFLITISGLFVVSALIGVIATGLDNKIQDLRKGRSFVIERDHTLVLGWSESVFTILSELRAANESQRDPVVVVMSEQDRVEMEDQIRAKVGHMGKTRVVCRTGSAIDLADLVVVNPDDARAIIVLSPEGEDPDAQVIKTLLALIHGPDRRPEPYHILAEIHDPANLEAARLVGGDEAILVDKRETVSRLIVQTSRQSGLAAAYTDLLDFGGAEVYFREDPRLAGRSFGDALHAYEECTVIGVEPSGGPVMLNPPGDMQIGAGDQVIAIAEDDAQLNAAVAASGPPDGAIDEALIADTSRAAPRRQRTLLLGWNSRAATVINELDKYVPPGSTATVVANLDEPGVEIERDCCDVANLAVEFRRGNTGERRTLDALDPASYDHVIVLCYSDALEAQRADALTLVTLLHLRDIAARSGADFTITSEMLDDRNRELAEVTQVDDVIVSDQLISLLLTQLAENRHLRGVFDELFRAEGSELYMRAASDYVRAGASTTFRTVVEAARRRGEVAVGYRTDGEVVMNPPKSEPLALGAADRVVVLAED